LILDRQASVLIVTSLHNKKTIGNLEHRAFRQDSTKKSQCKDLSREPQLSEKNRKTKIKKLIYENLDIEALTFRPYSLMYN